MSLIKKIAALFGLELKRIHANPDLSLYDSIPTVELKNSPFLNIGAGMFSHPYWTNIDKKSKWYKDYANQSFIEHDLFSTDTIKLNDGSAYAAYCSHTIEHIDDLSVQRLLNEIFRLLKPGGVVRIVTPDIQLQYRAYRDNDRHYFFWINSYSREKDYQRAGLTQPLNQASIDQIFLEDFASYASTLPVKGASQRISDEELRQLFASRSFEDALDYCTSLCPIELQKDNPQNHINWFHEKKLHSMLAKAGFNNIYRSAYGQSYCAPMRDLNFFDKTLPKVSLYMEARK